MVKVRTVLRESDEDLCDATPRKTDVKRDNSSRIRPKGSTRSARVSTAHVGRDSQFMDADEAEVREQIRHQLVAGVKIVGSYVGTCTAS